MSGLPAGQEQVTLLGLDFGSTTSSALVARSRVALSCTTGRMELQGTGIVYRSEPVFTPLDGDRLDLEAIRLLIETWLEEARLSPSQVFSGGAIVTGLAALRDNAPGLRALVKSLIGNAIVATAGDPRLESWLAFMGSVAALSAAHPGVPVLNLDIGGGTTNAALGRSGCVQDTGCAYIGARHVRVEPGTYHITGLSEFGRAMLDELAMPLKPGDTLQDGEAAALANWMAGGLEAIVGGDRAFFGTPAGRMIEQASLAAAAGEDTLVTFSGGVGELVYRAAAGDELPGRTAYGDLGIDLARAILASPRLSRDVHRAVPESKGRATVQGIALANTEVSGATLFLPDPGVLPLADLPVVASLGSDAPLQDFLSAVRLAATSPQGACIQISWPGDRAGLEGVRALGEKVRMAMTEAVHPSGPPLVLLTAANAGKAIGNYATAWQTQTRRLIVIDEIPVRNAQFVNIGRPRHGVVPVSFYGLS